MTMNMIPDALDFRYMLFDYYKKIGMSEEQLAVVVMIDHFLQQGNRLVTAETLVLKMNYPIQHIDQILVSLLNQGYLDYANVKGEMETSLFPLKTRLYREFQLDLAHAQEIGEPNLQNQIQNVLNVYQKELGRSLSPVEIQRVREWFSYGYAETMIIDALREALKRNRRSIRSIDKILLQWATASDHEKEGLSLLSETNKKDIRTAIEEVNQKLQDNE
ncbi:MAG: DnaD domain-containing protein [Bacilli bacterium]